jgi:hypothetical protein
MHRVKLAHGMAKKFANLVSDKILIKRNFYQPTTMKQLQQKLDFNKHFSKEDTHMTKKYKKSAQHH